MEAKNITPEQNLEIQEKVEAVLAEYGLSSYLLVVDINEESLSQMGNTRSQTIREINRLVSLAISNITKETIDCKRT